MHSSCFKQFAVWLHHRSDTLIGAVCDQHIIVVRFVKEGQLFVPSLVRFLTFEFRALGLTYAFKQSRLKAANVNRSSSACLVNVGFDALGLPRPRRSQRHSYAELEPDAANSRDRAHDPCI